MTEQTESPEISAERTLVLIKPDGVRRNLIGEVLRRVQGKGFALVRLDLRQATADLLAAHYAEHVGKPFYEPLVEFMSSGPVVSAVFEGERVIESFRALAGATDPVTAAPGSIRGDLGRDWGTAVQQNIVHGSDSSASAEQEIGIWYPPGQDGAGVFAADGAQTLERTLLLVKPDGVRRGLSGEVLRRVEAKGYRIAGLTQRTATPELLAAHYAEHVGKPFYEPLVAFMSSGPVVAAVIEGDRVVEGWRTLMGATDPASAAPGSVRGDLGRDWGTAVQQNLSHGSDSGASAEREIALWFAPS